MYWINHRETRIGIYTSSGFPKSHHRQVVDGSILTYRTHKNTPESRHRQVVDGSTPTCALNNGKQGLGLNHPPPAGGGIPGIFPVPGRLGLNDPPAPAGGIWLNIICVDTNGEHGIPVVGRGATLCRFD